MSEKRQSVEPNIADLANGWLRKYKLDYKLEQESINPSIDKALADYYSKNGYCRLYLSFSKSFASGLFPPIPPFLE